MLQSLTRGSINEHFGAGFHVAPGRAVDALAYDRFTGRWSRFSVPAVPAAAEVAPGVATGEAALVMLPIVGQSGPLIGAYATVGRGSSAIPR